MAFHPLLLGRDGISSPAYDETVGQEVAVRKLGTLEGKFYWL